jgi:hypothetical protein
VNETVDFQPRRQHSQSLLRPRFCIPRYICIPKPNSCQEKCIHCSQYIHVRRMPTFSSLIPGFSKAEMSAYLTSDCFDKALLNRRVRLVEVADRREIKKEAAFLHHQIAVKVPHMALVLYLTWLSCFTSHGSPALPHMALVLYLTWFSCFTSHGSRTNESLVFSGKR